MSTHMGGTSGSGCAKGSVLKGQLDMGVWKGQVDLAVWKGSGYVPVTGRKRTLFHCK